MGIQINRSLRTSLLVTAMGSRCSRQFGRVIAARAILERDCSNRKLQYTMVLCAKSDVTDAGLKSSGRPRLPGLNFRIAEPARTADSITLCDGPGGQARQ